MNRGRALGTGRLEKRGKMWTCSWTDELGNRRRKALSTDRRTAERIRAEIIRQRDLAVAGLGSEAGQEMPISELSEAYLADVKARVSSQHFKNVSQRLRYVVGQLGTIRVRDLTLASLTRFRGEAVSKGRSHRTANLLIDRVRAMLNWAVDAELIAQNPISRLKRLPETAEHKACRRRAMTDEEIGRFLEASRADDEENELRAALGGHTRVPQAPMWRTLLETGARYGEMRQLCWGDVDYSEKLLVLRAENTKSKKQRVIPLRDELLADLHALRVQHEALLRRLPNVADPVFLSPEGVRLPRYTTNAMRIFDRVLERAAIARVDAQGLKLDIHALRHTFNSRLARAGVALVHAQRLMGHSDPKLTAGAYMHLGVEDLRGAVEAIESTAKPERRSVRSAE